jgi:hypothetical protein
LLPPVKIIEGENADAAEVFEGDSADDIKSPDWPAPLGVGRRNGFLAVKQREQGGRGSCGRSDGGGLGRSFC